MTASLGADADRFFTFDLQYNPRRKVPDAGVDGQADDAADPDVAQEGADEQAQGGAFDSD